MRVSRERRAYHPNSSDNVRWCNQALSHGSVETHTLVKNDGQEVGNSVGGRSGKTEKSGEAPDLAVETAAEIGREVEWLCDSILTILLDTSNDEVGLLLVQEAQSERLALVGSVLWEIGDSESSDDCNYAGDQTLHNEDPSPACNALHDTRLECWVGLCWAVVLTVVLAKISEAVHLEEAICEDTRESRRQATDEVEHGVALLQIVSGVPARKEVGTSGEETSLEDTKNETKWDHLSPGLQEAEGDHSDTPKDANCGQEDSWSNFSENDGGRWLQEDVGDEEHQDDRRVAEADQFEINTHTSDDSNTQVGTIHEGDAVLRTSLAESPPRHRCARSLTMKPNVKTRRVSILQISFFCSSAVKELRRSSTVESSEVVRSRYTTSFFS